MPSAFQGTHDVQNEINLNENFAQIPYHGFLFMSNQSFSFFNSVVIGKIVRSDSRK